MRLSVIVPSYNSESFIEDTVASLSDYLKQSSPDGELIIVDDGSTDRSPLLLERLAASSSFARVLRCEANAGKGHAVRAGMAVATGDVRVFVDADLSYPTSEIQKMAPPQNLWVI